MVRSTAVQRQPAVFLSLYPRTSFDLAVDAVIEELARAARRPRDRCGSREATALVATLQAMVERSRASGYVPQLFTRQILTERQLTYITMIMPHGGRARLETAHMAIQVALLDPRFGERSIAHDGGSRGHCALWVLRE